MGVFLVRSLRNCQTFGRYYVNLVYSFLSGKLLTRKTFGDVYIVLAVADIHKWAIDL